MKTFKVFKNSIARELIRRGFIVVDIMPNFNNKDLTVFMFEDTKEFQKAFLDIKRDH